MQNRPTYTVTSVDHALQLAQLLQQEGSLRVTDAADRLGVSRSTAHRLLSMLVYRDFAEQGEDRSYRAGPVLKPVEPAGAPVKLLREVALPHLRALVAQVEETANLQVLAGDQVRFVASVECDQVLRAGDRVGRLVPAHLGSGGKAMLATLDPNDLLNLYAETDVDLPRLKKELVLVRKRGFAVNDQQTERGLSAVGHVIRDTDDKAIAAVALAIPSVRFDPEMLPTWVAALASTVTRIERDLPAPTTQPTLTAGEDES